MSKGIKINNLLFQIEDFREGPISLEIFGGEYFVLMGKTGSGKSLFLKAVCGFIETHKSTICLNGMEIGNYPISKRGIGYVPQGSYLFPHMKVIDNIVFALRSAGLSREKSIKEVEELIKLLEIDHLLNRKPQTLSGGERQKVALARALAARPELLILDEPVSALDEPSRHEICQVLKNIHKHYKITTVHVCHSMEECRIMADRVGIMSDGEIVQIGSLEEIIGNPVNDSVKKLVNL